MTVPRTIHNVIVFRKYIHSIVLLENDIWLIYACILDKSISLRKKWRRGAADLFMAPRRRLQVLGAAATLLTDEYWFIKDTFTDESYVEFFQNDNRVSICET